MANCCLHCGKELTWNGLYCSNACQQAYRAARLAEKWTHAIWNGEPGTVIENRYGAVLVDFGDRKQWIIKGIDGLTLFDRKPRGRPRQYQSQADKQRAYRERKAGKALRKYRSKTS